MTKKGEGDHNSKEETTVTTVTKKTTKRKPTKRKRRTASKSKKTANTSNHIHNIEHSLAKNIVALQKVNVDLAEKFDTLANQIGEMLALFELTARNFATKAPIGEYEKDKEFLTKIDRLLDQNKVLAKGLTLMEERMRERMYGANTAPKEHQAPAYNKPQEHHDEEGVYRSSLATPNRPLPRF